MPSDRPDPWKWRPQLWPPAATTASDGPPASLTSISGGSLARRAGGGAEESSAARAAAPSTSSGREPPTEPAPGLYDLPSLLGRIWSVPAARRLPRPAPSWPQAPAIEIPISDRIAVELRPPGPRRVDRSPWSAESPSITPSLPLAAVPSLTLSLPDAERPAPERDLEFASGPAIDEAVQYIAWKHPPCHHAFEPRPPTGAHCLRGWPDAEAALPYAGRARRASRLPDLMRPATPSWESGHRDGAETVVA